MSDEIERLRTVIRNYIDAEDAYIDAYPETDTSKLKEKMEIARQALRHEVA
jgi:hypothetical protein